MYVSFYNTIAHLQQRFEMAGEWTNLSIAIDRSLQKLSTTALLQSTSLVNGETSGTLLLGVFGQLTRLNLFREFIKTELTF